MATLDYLNSKLYNNSEAAAIAELRLHDLSLNFAGFADTSTPTPTHSKGNAYKVTEDGTVFGIPAEKGQWIVDDGTSFTARTLNGRYDFNLISDISEIPNIDSSTNKLDLGSDPVVLIGMMSFALKNIHGTDSPEYREISLTSDVYTGTAHRLYFNTDTATFKAVAWSGDDSDEIDANDVLVGGIREGFYYSFPFIHTVDGEFIETKHVRSYGTKTISKNDISADDFILYYNDKHARFEITDNNTSPFQKIAIDGEFSSSTYRWAIQLRDDTDLNGVKIFDSFWQTGNYSKNFVFTESDVVSVQLVVSKVDDSVLTLTDIQNILDSFSFLEISVIDKKYEYSYTPDTVSELIKESTKGLSTSKSDSEIDLKFYAHLGFHLNGVPENSLDAVRYAGRMGFDYIEMDFQPTSDGVLVLMHDDTINRTCRNASDYSEISNDVYVSNITFNDLRTNYVLAASDPRMRRPVPSLEEYFISCKKSKIFPIPEIKQGMTNSLIEQAYNLGNEILGNKKFGFASFSYPYLDYARSLSKNLLLLYIGNSILNTTNTVTLQSRESEKTIWYPNYSDITLVEVEKYRRKNMQVWVWTVPVSEYDNLLNKHVNAIASDTIAPNLNNFVINKTVKIIANSDVNWNDFDTNGATFDNKLTLNTGDYIQKNAGSIYLGAYYISVLFKGSISISAPNLNVSVSETSPTRKIYQGIVDNSDASFTITADADNAEVEFLEFYVVEL